jgi:acetyltransferase-like isoleucine patch superfamily enzyme
MLGKYTFFGVIRLIRDKLVTVLFYRSARLIRQPFYIRGKSNIHIGKNLTTGVGCRLDAFSNKKRIVLKIGDDVQINDYVHIGAIESISIGDRVLIASKVFITDHDHGNYSGNESPLTPPKLRKLHSSPVIIENDVWIGEFVSILAGVTIGKGAVIGAMSLVNKNVPPYSVAVGTPVRIMKVFDFDKNMWIKI